MGEVAVIGAYGILSANTLYKRPTSSHILYYERAKKHHYFTLAP